MVQRSFEVEILDTLNPPEGKQCDPKNDLRALEQLWLDNLSPFGERGYNVKLNTSVETHSGLNQNDYKLAVAEGYDSRFR